MRQLRDCDVARKETPAKRQSLGRISIISIPSTLFFQCRHIYLEAGYGFRFDKTARLKGAIESTATASWKVLGTGAGVAARVGGPWPQEHGDSSNAPDRFSATLRGSSGDVTPALVLSCRSWAGRWDPRAKAWLTAEAAVGVADLQSIPDGSEVFVSGKKIGLTPISTRLPAGKHEIEFHYAGVSRTETLDISAGKPFGDRGRLEASSGWPAHGDLDP